MSGFGRVVGLALFASGLLVASTVDGQERATDPLALAAELRSQAEAQGHLRGVLSALVQVRDRHPREALDALADSLVEVAADFSARGDAFGLAIKREAIATLVSAAQWTAVRGTPYDGTLERIVRWAYRDRSQGGGPSMLLLARAVVEQSEWLLLMRDFATSTHADAPNAIEILAGPLGGAEGSQILRELYQSDAVVQERAKEALAHQARMRGW